MYVTLCVSHSDNALFIKSLAEYKVKLGCYDLIRVDHKVSLKILMTCRAFQEIFH